MRSALLLLLLLLPSCASHRASRRASPRARSRVVISLVGTNDLHGRIHSGEVFLRLEHDGENRENKVVEIRLAVPGNDLFAKRQGKTFEEAAANTIEALRVQAERTKEKMRSIS